MKIASFNVENLDVAEDDRNPSLDKRIPTLRGILNRLDADILCLQEVHGQEPADPAIERDLSALEEVLKETKYDGYNKEYTKTRKGFPYDKRNLVVLTHYPIISMKQYNCDLIDNLEYRKVTAIPEEVAANKIKWERPILHVVIEHPIKGNIHIINIHLKSMLSTNISGQHEGYSWNSAAGWAEGYFLSSMKRVGQALETRILIDKILDEDINAQIIVCGDFNSEPGHVPVEAILGSSENTNNPKLKERVLIPCSRGIPSSVAFSHIHHGHGNLLDHMLISQSILPAFSNARIFNENLHDESLPFMFDDKYPESDHAPFLSEFIGY